MTAMTSAWLSRLYHGWKGPHPLHPSVVDKRLRPLSFRRFQPTDLQQCMDLYAANEPGRFPEGVRGTYEKCLTEQSGYFLVLEENNQIIASGGLSLFQRRDIAVLCFGLIDPKHQGDGIGTALLLVRLALLPAEGWPYAVLLFAVEKSIGFYRRFGFRQFHPWLDLQGRQHPSGSLLLSSREIVRCRKRLADCGISFPADHDQIPVRTKHDWETPANDSEKPA